MDFSHGETMILITAFKRFPILWNKNAVGYNDRKSKADAWRSISTDTGMHMEICKRKLESLMASCRREKAKILRSMESGEPAAIIEPKWRYWNELKFLRGLADDDPDPLGTAPQKEDDEQNVTSPWSTSKMLAHRHRKPALVNVSEDEMPSVSRMPEVQVEVQQIQPTQQVQTIQQIQPMQHIQQGVLTVKQDDEYTAIGIMVEAKLRKMNYDQRLFAENIINQALYKGLMFQLTEHSEIRNNDFPPEFLQGRKRKSSIHRSHYEQTHSVFVTESNGPSDTVTTSIKRRSSGNSEESESENSDDFKPISSLRNDFL